MKALCFLTLVLTLLLTTACHPQLDGTRIIYNESNDTLIIRYYLSSTEKDTLTEILAPGKETALNKIEGRGDKEDFACCISGGRLYSIRTAGGAIKKNPFDCANWEIPNKEKLKRGGGEPIRCEFHIRQSDL